MPRPDPARRYEHGDVTPDLQVRGGDHIWVVSFLQAAFLLPILQQLMADGVAASQFSELQEPEVIIVAPTRELINQIYLEARKFAHG